MSFLERTRKTFPNLIALEYQDYKLNYEQASIRCNALANFNNDYKFKPGSTVAVMLPNVPAMWECHYGVPKAGGY